MDRQETINHIEDCLNGRISADELSKWYFPIFKSQPLGTPEVEYRIYSALFLDLDEYLPPALLHLKTEYDIDENELRKRLVEHVSRLKALG